MRFDRGFSGGAVQPRGGFRRRNSRVGARGRGFPRCGVAVKIIQSNGGFGVADRGRSYLGWISAIERHGASILRGKA